MPSVAIEELWQAAMPADTKLLAGRAGLPRQVSWVSSLRSSFPLLGDLKQGCLVLARLESARQLDPRITPRYLLNQLHRAEAAGLVVDAPLSHDECALADDRQLPVLFSGTPDFVALERDLLRALVDREHLYARRRAEIRDRLRAVYGRAGVDGLLNELGAVLQGTVVLEDRQDVVGVDADTIHDGSDWQVRPVEMGGQTLGALKMVEMQTGRNVLTTMYLDEAAELCGIELIQRRARRETKDALKAGLLEALMDCSEDSDGLAARLARLGYSVGPDRRHCILAVQDTPSASSAEAEMMPLRDPQWAALRDGAQVICAPIPGFHVALFSFDRNLPKRRVRAWMEQADAGEGKGPAAGISRIVEGIEGLRTGMAQARSACLLGQLVAGIESPYYYEDLGLFRLLGSIADREELWRFYDETIAPLHAYDVDHRAELVYTLDVFFSQNANASRTARKLYVHRNTLNYRLQRIVEITGRDLNDAKERLDLQLGLKIHALRNRPE